MVVLKNNNPSELMMIREKVKGYEEYIGALEEEKRKIQVFERELPLCLDLVSQAIVRYKQKMSGTNTDCLNGEFDHYFEQISSEAAGGPLLEQLIPIKQTNEFQGDGNGNDEEEQQEINNKQYSCHKSEGSCSKKSDWLTSTQLSIQAQDHHQPIEKDLLSKRELSLERNDKGCGAFHPFQKKQQQPASVSSSADTDDGDHDKLGQYSNNKKQRRCWSPELHRRFLHALQQLGGAHVATPKQIRELMKVDGLTSDEIKSHLQKYRLHTRRLNPATHDTLPTHHRLVVVGQIWMPPLEYTTNNNAAASSLITDAPNNTQGVYSSIATTLAPSLFLRKKTMEPRTPSS
uniref:transcription factor HHO3-like n=1 Tax=Erigeron canadensis TaxID=72917 RepID=UPI001CB99CE3|nr:transcription factor HHO3-like [Erigeron canadensis]